MDIKRIPPVHTPDRLLDIAFRRASKEAGKVQTKNRALRRKRSEERRVKESARYITSYISRIERLGGLIEDAPEFYRELVDITIGLEKIASALDRLSWAKRNIARIEGKTRQNIRMSRGDPVSLRKEFYGKTASILGKTGSELGFLADVRANLKELPTIKEGFTVVIAGMPNVGKSSLLKELTSSKPRIEGYPFTTKSILLGYMKTDHRSVQIIDTPGLLDRPISKRNPIERQAALALKNLANLILFLFDPTSTCGYSLESQLRLYHEIDEGFEEVVPVVNKMDMAEEGVVKKLEEEVGRKTLRCSAANGEVEDVQGFIIDRQGKENIPAPRPRRISPR